MNINLQVAEADLQNLSIILLYISVSQLQSSRRSTAHIVVLRVLVYFINDRLTMTF
jgi:hypothetical protein